jgi:DNA primase
MGTALTKDQARLVKRYSENVLISYDGDFAGQSADLRGIEILTSEGLNVRVVPMPDGLDPDDVAKQGKEAYQKCLDSAMPLIDYRLHALERRYDLSKPEDKRRYLSSALKIIKTAESAAIKEELLKRLSNKAGISYAALERDLENVKGAPEDEEVEVQTEKIAEAEAGTDKHKKAKRFILAAKLFSAPYAAGTSLDELPFSDATHIIIASYISDRSLRGERIRPSELFELLDEDSEEFNAILDLNYGDKLTGEIAEQFFIDSVMTLKLQMLDDAIAECNARYIQETDLEKRKEISKTLQSLITQKENLKRRK